MAEEIIRQTAYKIPFSEIKKAMFFKSEGSNPSYMGIFDKKVSRINTIAIIVEKMKGETFQSLIIDDSTDRIEVRAFDKNLPEFEVGKIVNIIGRVWEYGTERYLLPETIKEVKKGWMEYRKKEIEIMMKKWGTEEKYYKCMQNTRLRFQICELHLKSIKHGSTIFHFQDAI